MTNDRLIKTKAVAELLGLSVSKVRQMMNPNHPNYCEAMPLPTKLGGVLLFSEAEVRGFQEQLLSQRHQLEKRSGKTWREI